MNHPELVAFYTAHRDHPDALYPSEARFLPWLARRSTSVLDAGCAAGGFYNIWRAFNPPIEYVGIDISPPLIQAARQLHPDVKFLTASVTDGVPLADASSDVVQALGWLHWEPRFDVALREMWRLTRRHLFFDVRLREVDGRDRLSSQRLSLTAEWDGQTRVPYVVADWARFAHLLHGLVPATILGYGYTKPPAQTVDDADSEVVFATFVLEKPQDGHARDPPKVCLDAPLRWPTALPANLLPSEGLETMLATKGASATRHSSPPEVSR